MAYVKHALGNTYYISKGSLRSGEIPIICLHGGPGGTHKGLKPLLELAKSGRKVFIYDQLGSGKSSKTDKSKWTIKTFVQELDLLVEAWGLEEFHLMGASWGTTLALEFYRHRKGKGIKSIIFQSPFFSVKRWINDANMLIGKMPGHTRKVLRNGNSDTEEFKLAMFEYYLKHVMRNETRLKKSMRGKSGFNAELYLHMWGPSEFRATGTLKTYEKAMALKKIKVPTLFVCGEFDEATPTSTKKFSKLVNGSKFKVLKGCSHSICNEKPKLLITTIDQFLK